MNIEKTASWLRPALQGLPFWIGHRKALYPHYPLPEAAIVAELCNLIQGKLPSDHILRCEVQCSEFLKKQSILPIILKRARIDLVIEPNKLQKQKGKGQTYLIEVKRSKAGTTLIEKDLDRLYEIKNGNRNLRAVLIVVSENSRPTRFVKQDGTANKKVQYTKNELTPFKVRGVVKAASSFGSFDKAHYACFIEVLEIEKSVNQKT